MTTKKNNKITKKMTNNQGNLPVWKLSDLYDSPKGKKISADLKFIEYRTKKLQKCGTLLGSYVIFEQTTYNFL